jgi:hypothetical protein
VTNALALLPFGNGVHYDSEAQRRPLLHHLVGDGTLPAVSYATDDHVGLLYENEAAIRVLSDGPSTSKQAAAYVVQRLGDGRVDERRLPVGATGSELAPS